MTLLKEPQTNEKDYNRRPQMNGGPDNYLSFAKGGGAAGTYRELISQTTDFVAIERVQKKHSEFKKPYLFDEYPEMEFFYEAPQIDSLGNISLADPDPVSAECWDVCSKNHTGFYVDNNCYVYIWLHVDLQLKMVNIDMIKQDKTEAINGIQRTIYKSKQPQEDGTEIIWQVFQPMFDACPKVDERIAKSCQKTKTGTISCVDCPVSPEMSWDDDISAETINQNDNVTIAVQGGAGPYSWSVSGTGFSLSSSTTTDVTNTLISDASACGTATITVTDSCGMVTGYVRCVVGNWVLVDSRDSATDPLDKACPSEIQGTPCQSGGADTGYCEVIKGKTKIYEDHQGFSDISCIKRCSGEYHNRPCLASNADYTINCSKLWPSHPVDWCDPYDGGMSWCCDPGDGSWCQNVYQYHWCVDYTAQYEWTC